MKQFFYRALNVREGEETLLLLIWGVFFFMGVSIIYVQSASSSLFLKFIGIEYLPLLFIAEPVMMLPISVGYTKLLDRVESRKLVLSSFARPGGVFLGRFLAYSAVKGCVWNGLRRNYCQRRYPASDIKHGGALLYAGSLYYSSPGKSCAGRQ